MARFPDSFPVAEAMLVIDKIRGKPVGRKAAIEAGWWVAGFALAQIPDDQAVAKLMFADQAMGDSVALQLEKAFDPANMSAIDWKAVWQYVKWMLDLWLSEA